MKPRTKLKQAFLHFGRMVFAATIFSLFIPATWAFVINGPATNAITGHWYYLLGPTNWFEAETEAVRLGGHLVTINDAEENAWIVSTFGNYNGVGRTIWLGLTDSAQEEVWTWITGEPATYFNWSPGEPNSGGGFYPEEDYAAMQPPGSNFGKWNDAPPELNYAAVVEVTTPIPPQIIEQPQSLTVISGEDATFLVSVAGTPPFSYQWLFNGTNLVGSTTNPLILANTQMTDTGYYSVVVSNVAGFDTSGAAYLGINPASPCAAIATGIQGWWPGNNMTADIANGNSGTLMGNATYGSGRVGKGFVFDGNRDGVQIGMATNLQLQDFSIEAWIKRASTTTISFNGNGHGSIFAMGSGGGYWFHLKADSTLALGKLQVNDVVSGAQIADTNWHHVAVVKVGTAVSFFLDGTEYLAPVYVSGGFTFSAPGCIGGWQNPSALVDNSFYGSIDELAVYNRSLTAGEIQEIYTAGLTGKCPVPVAPVIATGPRDTNALAGGSVTFPVQAGGALPLRYQWRFNDTAIADATNSTLTITNIQFSHVGNYSVLVTNNYGSTQSSAAALNVIFPPAVVRVPSTNAMAGSSVVLPITIAANGNENALGFSLNFSTQRLAFASATLGSGATGAALLLNTSMTATGRLGLAVVLPYQSSFAPGTQEVVRVTFNSLPLLGAQSVATPVTFADQPITRELSNVRLQTLSAFYSNSTVTLLPTIFESDVAPRTAGNQNVSTTDWLQIGRFIARLDQSPTNTEFQRADCAPRASLGDGQLKIVDWVQTGRYLAGLDPLKAIGGPNIETVPTFSGTSNNRQLIVANANTVAGQAVTVGLNLAAQGNENALGFTLAFDPTALAFSSVELDAEAGGATLIPNTNQVSSGKLGLALALTTGSNFSAGLHKVIRINFLSTGSQGVFPLHITDQIVTRCLSDTQADELPVSFVDGEMIISSVHPLPTLAIAQSGSNAIISWPDWAGDFALQTTDVPGLLSHTWSNVSGPLQTNDGKVSYTAPLTNQTKIFRLQR